MVACITVQLGQCGTQVGHQLLNTLFDDAVKSSPLTSSAANEEYKKSSLECFFNETERGPPEARSVMIDMEQKVVTRALHGTSAKAWRYAKGQQFCEKSGSGNNWSYGFKVHAPRCEEAIYDLMRREVEKCDHFGGFLILSSLAGGTGSGLGSYVTGMLRDNFPRAALINPVVCPYSHGEVAVQNYNAVLSLAHTCSTTDANILFHNDNLHQICSRLLGVKNVSFKDVNGVIADQLASILQPIFPSPSYKQLNVLSDILDVSASHGHYTMLNLKSLPLVAPSSVAYSTFSWDALLRRIYQMMITDFYMDEGLDWHRKLPKSAGKNSDRYYPRYTSNLLVMRGKEALLPPEQDIPEFQDERLYSRWIPHLSRCPIWKTNVPFQKHEKSVVLLSNGTPCVKPLDELVSKAWQMFGSRAYLHQYTKHGLENDDFVNAFVAVESVISAYKQL